MSEPSKGLKLEARQAGPIPLEARLACASGEALALVGPSGSGKTTLLRCIAGLHRPREGRIACNGAVWFDAAGGVNVAPSQRRIGMVFQQYALFPHLTALENVMEALTEHPREERRRRAGALLDRMHLKGLGGRKPRELSGGQQQRVAVARALARDPEVLLLDEPFSAVDRATREALHEDLAELRRGLSMPLILVTHDLEEASILADRMCMLARGTTVQTGTPYEVVERPASVEVARMVGMKNLFEGRVAGHSREAGVTQVDWNGRRLAVGLREEFPPGTRVAWGIPASGVLLPPLDARTPGGTDHAVEGRVARVFEGGEQVRLHVSVAGEARPLVTTLPRHIAVRYALREGNALTVRLRGERVHLMAAEGGGAG